MTEHICPDCNHPVSEHKEFFCQHVYCLCNMGNVAAEAKYKLQVAIDALSKIESHDIHYELDRDDVTDVWHIAYKALKAIKEE